jgi:holo-[acyl-carrier protein] synthase
LIVGIGVDLVEIDRVESLLTRHPGRGEERLYTAGEVAYCRGHRSPAESFAARFAAKEALFKALGTGWGAGTSWREVEVLIGDRGAPRMRLHGETARLVAARGVQHVHVTLTHTQGLACAVVILEGSVEPQRLSSVPEGLE